MSKINAPEHNITCPLCNNSDAFSQLEGPKQRKYQRCHHCQLIFMERQFLPDSATEKSRYQAHQNNLQNEGYVQFLNLAITPALPYLKASMRGLDYGCGPVPVLGGLLKAHGLHCENYDPFFFPKLPDHKFEFIFATEVIEHFFNPGEDFQRILALLKPGGILTVMTELWDSVEKFSEWHYARDNTHVSFYHEKTMQYIYTRYNLERLNPGPARAGVYKKTGAIYA